jgi:hypothetical protein
VKKNMPPVKKKKPQHPTTEAISILRKMITYAKKGEALEQVKEQYRCYRDLYRFKQAVFMALYDYSCETVGDDQ